MRHLISPLDFSVDETNYILTLAGDIYRNPEKYKDICHGKKLATLSGFRHFKTILNSINRRNAVFFCQIS